MIRYLSSLQISYFHFDFHCSCDSPLSSLRMATDEALRSGLGEVDSTSSASWCWVGGHSSCACAMRVHVVMRAHILGPWHLHCTSTNAMGRWLCLLLLESIISLTLTFGSVINATEDRCIQLKLSDVNSLSFRGLLLQKHEQVNLNHKILWRNAFYYVLRYVCTEYAGYSAILWLYF